VGRREEHEAALRRISEMRLRARLAGMSLGDLTGAIERRRPPPARPALRLIRGGK
jgi:hypothetical protein